MPEITDAHKTQALAGRSAVEPDELDAETTELAGRMPETLSAAAYEEGLDLIVGALAQRLL